jgi:molybdopterin/thiamine biosynthesis adenylyltransferase
VIYPGESVLQTLYGGTAELHGEEEEQGTLAFTAGALASLQAAEAAKVLLGKSVLRGQILEVDLLSLSFTLLKVL